MKSAKPQSAKGVQYHEPGGFKEFSAVGALIACLVLTSFSAAADTPRKQGYDAFRLVQTRNIFDPKRNTDASLPSQTSGAAAQATGTTETAAPATAPTGGDYAALTGILITEEKTLAFFSGSRSDYNKVLSLNASIAGATIDKITPSAIEVQRGGKKVTVAIGQTVPLDNSSLPAPAPFNPAPATATATDSAPSSSDAPPASSDREALVRRMMERRQKELK